MMRYMLGDKPVQIVGFTSVQHVVLAIIVDEGGEFSTTDIRNLRRETDGANGDESKRVGGNPTETGNDRGTGQSGQTVSHVKDRERPDKGAKKRS